MCFYKGKEVRSRSDRDRELQLSWAHTVTLIHTDINFRVTDSVANPIVDLKILCKFVESSVKFNSKTSLKNERDCRTCLTKKKVELLKFQAA